MCEVLSSTGETKLPCCSTVFHAIDVMASESKECPGNDVAAKGGTWA